MRKLSAMGDLIVLNFLWLICSLPVVTAGASTTALYAVALKLAQEDDGHMFRRFFKAFRQSFTQATVVHLALCALTALLTFDFYSYAQGSGGMVRILQFLLAVVSVIAVVFASWFFPITAQFENTTRRTCKNALQLAVLHWPVTLRIAITNVLFFVTTFLLWTVGPGLLIFAVMFGGSGAAYLNSFALRRCFAKYIPAENTGDMDT